MCRGSSHGIMMLVDTHLIKHLVSWLHNLFDFFISSWLINCFHWHNFARSMEKWWSIPNLFLCVWSWSKVSSPIVFRQICVWEHIWISCWPSWVNLMDSIYIFTWSWVLDCCVIIVVFINKFDHSVHWVEVLFGIGVCEVASHWNKDIICSVVISPMSYKFHKSGSFWLGIVCLKSSIINKSIILFIIIECKSGRWAIVDIHCMSEDLYRFSKTIKHWSLYPLHRFFFYSLCFILVV